MKRLPPLRERLEMLVPPLPWDRPRLGGDGPLVVLLHGLWRGWRAMEPLARRLRAAGFSTLNIPYPSTRLPVPELASRIQHVIQLHSQGRETSWVTHSLGGIIAREILARNPEAAPQKLIMLAPPNAGSEIVDWAHRHPPIHFLLGPAGRSLGSDGLPARLPPPPPTVETTVIMGSRGSIPFFRRLLDPENDGIVSVSRGRLEGVRAFSVVDADHTFIQTHEQALQLCLRFLKGNTGKPSTASSPSPLSSATD
jgi:pimeloyl-ACP methyl ester carboxylesterase